MFSELGGSTYAAKLFTVIFCLGSQGRNELKLSSSETVSCKRSPKMNYDLLSVINFTLYLPLCSAGQVCVWVQN